MASRTVRDAYFAVADLKLWYSEKSGDNLTLSDIPEIIPMRWEYFRDFWEFIRPDVLESADNYAYPDLLRTQANDLTDFINRQKNSQNKAINPFSSSNTLSRFYAVWSNINVSSLATNRQEQRIIDDKLDRISKFIRTDFEHIRDELTAARDELADVVGLSDATYNSTVRRSSVSALKSVKISDIANMQVFQSAIKSVNYILANSNKLSTIQLDPFALARENANNSDIQIATGRSVRLVRMKFGDNLQTLADRYLGDSDRWIEIAIANGLKPPYVDEIGEAISLLSNGENNKINFASITNGTDTAEKLYIGQPVFLSSAAIKFPEQRKIANIKIVPISGELIVELDGESDLDKYTLIDNAVMRVYKPNTVNSSFFVAIPTNQPLENNNVGETPFFLEASSEDEKRAAVDLLIDDDGDVVFGSNGDFQLSFGVANALQAVKLKVLSEKGQLKRHPNYGLPSVTGEKERDPVAIKQTLINGINEMINADPRFDRIEQIEVQRGDRTDIRIGLVVRMAGTGTLIPLSFKLNTD